MNTSETVKSEHTPTPWKWHKDEAMIETALPNLRGEYHHICDFRANALTGEYNEANAQFIVTACNAHEVLLDACKCALNSLDAIGATKGSPLVHQLRRAISLATNT